MSSNDASVRRILPQNSQMNSFSFAPQQYPPQRETQKNYVFVDEHNRHKRLKVMRACEGCRRRKIKCDAATTNTWPCSACIRLKLNCVKPNGYDGATDSTTYETQLTQADQYQQIPMQQQILQTTPKQPQPMMYATQPTYGDIGNGTYAALSYDATPPQHNLSYASTQPPMSMMDPSYTSPHAFPTPPLQHDPQTEPSPEAYSPGDYSQAQLADLLGNLKVNEVGTAPYLRNKASFRREEQPAVEEADDYKNLLPPTVTGPGSKIRIPPELMPDEETALNYFNLFFTHVHPYVPVLNKPLFFQQWQMARESISPLILEAIFAIGGRLAEDPTEGQQWLALASRHADSFMDVPRLSTLQALLLILKAREAAPKRGYYYRSWMTVVQCVQMAKDLGLDEHYEDHDAGRFCEHSPQDCQLRTRIWQVIFVCETMVGTPQGRHDLAVRPDSVDFEEPQPVHGGDDSEYQASRNFTYFARVVRNVRKLSDAYARLKSRKQKDWGIDPEFQQLNHGFTAYLAELPPDLSIAFPQDGSPPWIPTHFLGNMHAYYHLSLILAHRPQLTFADPNSPDGQWKHQFLTCYGAAKTLCRLQEATLNIHGLPGLQSMQRGYSFTVYAGLSCIVLHLVAIVSPDPDVNNDAREFFTRHMRILERVMEAWSMPELEKQINAVREAFSADIRKPFVLKPSFPYGSPHPSNLSCNSSPVQSVQGYRPPTHRTGSLEHQLDTQGTSQPLVMMAQGSQAPGMQSNMSLAEQTGWNPSRIFEQWNTTFGTPAQRDPSTTPPQPTSLSLPSSSGVADLSTFQDLQNVQNTMPTSTQQISPQFSTAAVPNFMTASMWQESVASVYEGGLKRAWDYDAGPVMKRH